MGSNISSIKEIKCENGEEIVTKEAMREKGEAGIKEEYDKQVNVPKPLLVKMFSLLGFDEVANCSRCCKQFYFLIKADNFWRVFAQETFPGELETLVGETWQEKVKYKKLAVWDEKLSSDKLEIKGRLIEHKSQGIANAISKVEFRGGEESLFLEFEMSVCCKDLMALGICLSTPKIDKNNWLVNGQFGLG